MHDRNDKRLNDRAIANVERLFKREDLTHTNTEALKELCCLKLADATRPVFAVFLLNCVGRLITYRELFSGRLGDSPFYPRKILAEIIAEDASGVVLAHYDPQQTSTVLAGRELRQLDELCQTLYNTGIELRDYIVVHEQTAISLREQNKLPAPGARMPFRRLCI